MSAYSQVRTYRHKFRPPYPQKSGRPNIAGNGTEPRSSSTRLGTQKFWRKTEDDSFHNQPFDSLPPEKVREIAEKRVTVSEELGKYMVLLLARKLVVVKATQAKNILLIGWYAAKALAGRLLGKKPEPAKDDIVSRMLASSFAKEVDFSLVRLGVNAGGLLIGSIETTSQAVSQVIEFFLDRPDLMSGAQRAARRDDPSELDSMVWEALRFVPISPYLFRQASQDYTIAKPRACEFFYIKPPFTRVSESSVQPADASCV